MPRIPEDLLDAIAQVESGGDPAAVGDRGLRDPAIGMFQMRQPAYQDIQRLYPQEWAQQPFEALQGNAEIQRQAARAYLQALQDHYGLTGDALIAGYNAGPSVRKKGIRNPGYVSKVRKQMGNPTMTRFKK